MTKFLKNHPLGAPVMVFGTALVLFGYGNDIMEIWELGASRDIIILTGAALFMFSVAGMIYRQHNRLDALGAYHVPELKRGGGSFEEPNYQAWDGVIYFTPAQAACLWGETIPVDDLRTLTPSAKACLQMIKEEMESGRLKPVMISKGQKIKTLFSDPRGKVQRMDLLNLAKRKNQKPKFLFPEARKKSKNEEGWLRN